jgi:disulfide bond formation protein DsbB
MATKRLSFFGALGALASVLFAMALERQGFSPCPLCLVQRWALGITGLFLIFIFLINTEKQSTKRFLALFGLLFSVLGLAAGLRQLYLQYMVPPAQIPQCMGDLNTIFKNLPFLEALKTLLTGSGDCALIDWQFFGLSLAGWSSIAFLLLVLLILKIIRNP